MSALPPFPFSSYPIDIGFGGFAELNRVGTALGLIQVNPDITSKQFTCRMESGSKQSSSK
jgi:hypothetical protein